MQLLPRSMVIEKVAFTQQQALARKRLKTLISNKKRELQHYACI